MKRSRRRAADSLDVRGYFSAADNSKRKKRLLDISNLTYMQVSTALFAIGVCILIGCLVRAVLTGGRTGTAEAVLMAVSQLLAICGILFTLYGHQYIGIEKKLSWKLGIALNGGLLAVHLLIIIAGLIP